MTSDHGELQQHLRRIDGRGYPAYKDLRGSYRFPGFTLHVDHVQGDPYAAPSRMRVWVPSEEALFPEEAFASPHRRIGLEHYLSSRFAARARGGRGRRGSGKSGLLEIDAPGQQVLERTAVQVFRRGVEARFSVGLPAAGRRILGRQAAELLCDDLPRVVESSLLYSASDPEEIRRHGDTNQDAAALREALAALGLVAFVADGAVLPRRSGVDPRPLEEGAIPFRSPASLRVTVSLPNAGTVTGLGIPRGVTLIVGGGFHGKSTLLSALELGIYNHAPGDGREQVVSDPGTVKIRAEDGRRVEGVDISPFIGGLPGGIRTDRFRTENASGSTSQAAGIIEALEVGARVLLIDEDTAATNFMIRDRRMQELIAKPLEPITPFIDRVVSLHREHGVSSVLVVGGSGDYFDVADRVIALENFEPREVTEEARDVARRLPTGRRSEGSDGFDLPRPRIPEPRSVDPAKGRRDVSVKARGLRAVQFGRETIDLAAVEQLVHPSQTRALGDALVYAREEYMDGHRDLAEVLDLVEEDLRERGLDVLSPHARRDYASFRRFELAAALNRLRSLRVS